MPAQRGDRRGGVAGGDLAQVIVAPGPLFQERVHAAEVDAGGTGAARQGPGRSVLQGVSPAAGAGGDARRQRGEPALGPRVHGCCPALKIPISAAFTMPMKNRAFRASS